MVAVNGLQQQTWGSPYNDGSDQWLQSLVEAEGASSVGDESGGGDHSQWQQAGSQSSKRFTPTGEFGTMVTAAPAAAPIAPPRPGAATFAKAKAAVTKASANAATEEPIHAAWQRFSSASPYRLMQQMAEHKWSAKDVAQATGQTEQAVGDYLTIHGAPKGFGGEVTIGQEAIAEPYMRALDAAYSAMPQERVIATRNLSGPWSDEDGSPPQYGPVPFWNVQQVSRYVDGSGWTEETVSFDLAAFNQWYFSQGTPESVALARMPGLLGSLTAPAWDRHEQGEGGHVYWSWRASHLSWGTDPQRDAIRAYLSYPAESEETVQELSLVAFDPLMTGELLHAFGTDQLALPETAQGERMRARFGSELATQLYRIDRSQEALRASYAAALDLAMGTKPPDDGNLLPAGVTQRYEAYPGWSVTLVKGSDGGADRNVSEFDLVAFHEWYVKQDDPKAKLFVQFYGDQLEVQETRLQSQEDASYTIQRTYLTGQGNGFRVDAGYTVRDENSETHIGSSISPQGYVLVDLARPPRLFNDEVVYFDPVMGFMTVPENIKPKDTGLFEQLVTTGMLVAVSFVTGGVAAAAGWASLTTAAVTGAMSSIAGTFLTGGELTLRGIFKGALTSVLTAGLMDRLPGLAGLEGLKDLLPANAFERGSLSLVAGRTAVQGIVSTVMGDSFKDGLRAGLVSGVAEALSAELNDNIDLMEQTNVLTGAEVHASRAVVTMLARALRVVASGEQNPAYAYARGLLGDLMEGLDKVKPAAPETSPASTEVESTEVAPEAATPVAVPAAGVAPAPATADSSSGDASQASENTLIGEETSQPATPVGLTTTLPTPSIGMLSGVFAPSLADAYQLTWANSGLSDELTLSIFGSVATTTAASSGGHPNTSAGAISHVEAHPANEQTTVINVDPMVIRAGGVIVPLPDGSETVANRMQVGETRPDLSAPRVPAHLLPTGIRPEDLVGAVESGGVRGYKFADDQPRVIDGVPITFIARSFFEEQAQEIVSQPATFLQSEVATPSQVLESSRFLTALQMAELAENGIQQPEAQRFVGDIERGIQVLADGAMNAGVKAEKAMDAMREYSLWQQDPFPSEMPSPSVAGGVVAGLLDQAVPLGITLDVKNQLQRAIWTAAKGDVETARGILNSLEDRLSNDAMNAATGLVTAAANVDGLARRAEQLIRRAETNDPEAKAQLARMAVPVVIAVAGLPQMVEGAAGAARAIESAVAKLANGLDGLSARQVANVQDALLSLRGPTGEPIVAPRPSRPIGTESNPAHNAGGQPAPRPADVPAERISGSPAVAERAAGSSADAGVTAELMGPSRPIPDGAQPGPYVGNDAGIAGDLSLGSEIGNAEMRPLTAEELQNTWGAGPASQVRVVPFQRTDLSVKLSAETGEGGVYVVAEGERHQVGVISVVDGSPQFYLDNRVVTSSGESIKLSLDGGSLTRTALEDTIAAYKGAYGVAPPSLPGSLADANLANFQYEFQQAKLANPTLTDQAAGDLAIRNISFGSARAAVGYGNLSTTIGSYNAFGLPTRVTVNAIPGF